MTIAPRARRPIFSLLAAAVAAAALQQPALAAAPTGKVLLAPYRAVYELRLDKSRGIRTTQAVNGRIVINFSGSSCEGYAQQFHQATELLSVEGETTLNDLRGTTWEDGAARIFRFYSITSHDNAQTETVDGHAERDAKSVTVSLRKPKRESFREPADAVFPVEQIRRLIEAARAGRRIVAFPVYDGSETGKKLYNTMTVIGRAIPPGSRPPDSAAGKDPAMNRLTRWPVTISYYDQENAQQRQSGEQTPAYITGFELYENGIARALQLTSSDIIIKGRLTSLKVMKPKPCH